jgi:hypothetical protein
MFGTEYLRRILKNSKLRLFLLYGNTSCLVKSLQLAKLFLDKQIMTEDERSIFVIQALFQKLKNSRGQKVIQKMLMTKSYPTFEKS